MLCSIFAAVLNVFDCLRDFFCPVFVEKCGKYANFPTVMMSYHIKLCQPQQD